VLVVVNQSALFVSAISEGSVPDSESDDEFAS
jgi:hypothetical protein